MSLSRPFATIRLFVFAFYLFFFLSSIYFFLISFVISFCWVIAMRNKKKKTYFTPLNERTQTMCRQFCFFFFSLSLLQLVAYGKTVNVIVKNCLQQAFNTLLFIAITTRRYGNNIAKVERQRMKKKKIKTNNSELTKHWADMVCNYMGFHIYNIQCCHCLSRFFLQETTKQKKKLYKEPTYYDSYVYVYAMKLCLNEYNFSFLKMLM